MMNSDPSRTETYWRAMHNISQAVEFKRRKKLAVTLGIQTFVTPDDEKEIREFAQLGIDLNVQYAVIKHHSDDEYGSFGIKYDEYGRIYDALHEAEAMSTPETQVVVKWNKIRMGNRPSYKRFYAPVFLLQISGSGLVAPSGMYFNS